MPKDNNPHTNGGEDKPFLSEEDKKLLREQYLKDYKSLDVEIFLRRCERTRIDPMTGQIFMRPEGKEGQNRGSDGKYSTALTITGVQGFLAVADRSGVYDGSSPMVWCGKEEDWTDIWRGDGPPFAARAEAWRKDRTRPAVAIVKWRAVYKATWAWNSMGDHMLAKCALCAALRLAFPSQLTGVYETDEIIDKDASTLAQDISAQEERIKAEKVAAETLSKQPGVTKVEHSGPSLPRDARLEVEPADNLDMSPAKAERPTDWWKYVSCDPIKAFAGKQVNELTYREIEQAVEKWVPRVRAKWDITTEEYRALAEALELASEEAQMVEAQRKAKEADQSAEGPQ